MSENTEELDQSQNQDPDQGREQQAPNAPHEHDPTKIRIEKNPGEVLSGLAGFIKSTLSLRDGKYNVELVLENVRDGIVFKGYNVWILMFSIIIASVGLNTDSTAVIIGAMLISPLMGPIRGIGFGVGTNDFKLLLESLKNFGITVSISLLTSFLYFLVTPIDALTENIFARTEPTFLDVVIAFFGGLAGVVAQSKNKADTVIPGVAIATALMPPLCTAGYGLAMGEWQYFAGASYLFLLNTLLIATSTYVFVRYLRFPKIHYVTPKIEKRVKGYTLAFIIVVVAPSGYLFYKMTKRSIFESNASTFVEEVVMNADENIVVTPTYNFDWDNSSIQLAITNFYADQQTLDTWNRQKSNYDLSGVHISVKQDKDFESIVDQKLQDYDLRNKGANTLAELISQKENQLLMLQKKLQDMQDNPAAPKDPLQLDNLLAGFKVDYPEYQFIAVDRSYSLNKKNQLDTSYVIRVVFKNDLEEDQQYNLNSKLSRRVRLELLQKANIKQDTVKVITLLRDQI
ncbi:MAG: DUF389 domain-containing protein [Crocinitomicaceae bacterium]|nr:DUF389 domain-containing protein [Crocinitomicaceae bacterium]